MSGKNILDGSDSRRQTANDQGDQGKLQESLSWLAIPSPRFTAAVGMDGPISWAFHPT